MPTFHICCMRDRNNIRRPIHTHVRHPSTYSVVHSSYLADRVTRLCMKIPFRIHAISTWILPVDLTRRSRSYVCANLIHHEVETHSIR